MVRDGRLELPTSCSQSKRATNCANPGFLVIQFCARCGQTCGQAVFLTTSTCGGSACIAGVSRDCGHGIFRLEGGATRSQSRRATNCATPRYEVRRSGWAYSPKPPALPTALIPDIRFFCMILCGEGKSKFFVSVGSAVVKAGFAGGSSGGGFPPQATVPRTSGLSLLGEWIDRLSSQSRRATNCATPGYEVVGWPGRILPKEVLSIFYSCL